MFEGEHAKNLISAVLLYDIYSFWCCVLDNLIFMGLLHTMLNFWLISWFELMDVFNTLVYFCKFLFSLSLPLFVPLLCSIVFVVLSCVTLSTITFVP